MVIVPLNEDEIGKKLAEFISKDLSLTLYQRQNFAPVQIESMIVSFSMIISKGLCGSLKVGIVWFNPLPHNATFWRTKDT